MPEFRRSLLEEAVAALGVGARLEISRAVRSGISAAKVDVWVNGEKDLPREEYWEREERERYHSDQRPGHAHEHERGEIRILAWRGQSLP